jgi:hypothetical protein
MAENPSFDRVPPHSAEAEMAVLGSMLLNRDAAGVAVASAGGEKRQGRS